MGEQKPALDDIPVLAGIFGTIVVLMVLYLIASVVSYVALNYALPLWKYALCAMAASFVGIIIFAPLKSKRKSE